MHNFEKFLLENGYLKFTLNCQSMRYESTSDDNSHNVSSMVNLDHRYYHSSDTSILRKISNGKSLKDFTPDERDREICFGLHERKLPATLIYPRPCITVKKLKNKSEEIVENDRHDSSMYTVLENVPYADILEAMYDKNIILNFDFTTKLNG